MKKNFILSMVAVAGMSIGLSSCNCGAPQAKLATSLDSVAYAFGVMQGAQFAAVADSSTLVPGEQVSLDEFLAGFVTAVKRDSSALKMTSEEADTFLRAYFDKVRQEMMEKQKAEADAAKAEGADFMQKNATAEGVVTTESGLQYKADTKGTGKTPKGADKVKINYKGSLLNGTVFDSTEGKEPIEMAANRFVPGFTEGLYLMNEGSKYTFWIPADLAYGDRGQQGIPAGSTLKFEVELISVTPEAPAKKK